MIERKSKGISRVQTNLIQQNVYVRDVTRKSDLKTPVTESYYSLEEVSDGNSVREELVEHPYHITPQYVNSFVESADYRRDPASAVLNAPKRQNLGDVRDVQKLGSLDMVELSRIYAQLKSLFGAQDSNIQSAGTQSAGTQSAGTQSAGTQSTGV